jgi:hypothetical protein
LAHKLGINPDDDDSGKFFAAKEGNADNINLTPSLEVKA